ncbi:hypothetical protein BDV12DRAFT_204824 [Aspergillus spectabilis]
MSAPFPKTIGVLGAGVIGLQTALILKEAGFDVVIVAKDFPGSEDPLYTSTWSGAQWRSNISIGNQQDWDRQTFQRWSDLVQTTPPETLGLQLYPATYLWDHSEDSFRPEDSHWWTKSFIPDFHVLSSDQVAREGPFAAGMTYQTFAICPTRYLTYLRNQCAAQGIPCHAGTAAPLSLVLGEGKDRHEIFSMAEFKNVMGIVNWPNSRGSRTGLATRRGREGWEALIIPWPGTNMTMLGGCKIPGEWSTQPDEAITQMILEQCKPLAPELLDANGEFEVRRVRVGLRPARHGGPRMQLERCPDGRFICHAYGHDSAGYEGSVGIAREILNLVADHVAARGL